MTQAEFEVDVTTADMAAFSELSGDWNPLHNDPAFAKAAGFGKLVLHGAFSAGLISRLAGMHLPGESCLLHNMSLRFVAAIFPPVRLRVSGKLIGTETRGVGNVEALVQDAISGNRHVSATYEYSRSRSEHRLGANAANKGGNTPPASEAPIIVTGASGGLGQALLSRLGNRGLGASRSGRAGEIAVSSSEELAEALAGRSIGGIVHCGWPMPDNERLIALSQVAQSVEHHVSAPLRDIVSLAQLVSKQGRPNAMLILIGSTFAEPGRHGYRMPLYSLAKSMVPTLAQTLAIELAPSGHRCAAITFDMIDGGMNKTLSRASRVAHADRSPFGRLANLDDAASQILWLINNESVLASGATIKLSGGSIP